MKKRKRTKGMIEAEKNLDFLLKKVGYTGKYAGQRVNKIPDFSSSSSNFTSNKIPTNGSKKQENIYTGIEISGIVCSHKSNLMPIRKDNPQAAIDAASMRR